MQATFDYHGWELKNDFMVLRSESGDVQLPPTTLLIAIDDTGDPTTRDPIHPVFGLGGCAMLVGQYLDSVALPWYRLKQVHFDGADVPLHASGLRPSVQQIEGLNEFFQHATCFRFAAVLTDRMEIRDPAARVELAALMMGRLLTRIGSRVPFSKIAMLFDRSERLGPALGRVFKGVKYHQSLGGVVHEVSVELCDASKDLCLPATEIADFVVHTAGGAVRRSLNGTPFLSNPDFRAVFETEPQELSEFVRLDAVEITVRAA
jgi:hypothetical protein